MKARVIATIEQLVLVGIDLDITQQIVEVSNKDQFGGICPPNSMIHFDHPEIKEAGVLIKCEYIFPTRWLDFSLNE